MVRGLFQSILRMMSLLVTGGKVLLSNTMKSIPERGMDTIIRVITIPAWRNVHLRAFSYAGPSSMYLAMRERYLLSIFMPLLR